MSDKDMVTVYERRDGSKPGLWSVYWYLGWDVFYSFSLAVGITSKNTMMAIVQAFCLLVFSWTHRLAVEPSDLEHHRLPGAGRHQLGEGGSC